MGIRTNTLGKSAIINQQLNTAYDVVEYVANNLPILTNMVSIVEAIKAQQDLAYITNHIENDEIHLSCEQNTNVDEIPSIIELLNTLESSVQEITSNFMSFVTSTNTHIDNGLIHVTQADKARWDSLVTSIPSSLELAKIAYSGSYKDLLDKPVIDDYLSTTSNNSVENKAITTELNKKVNRDALNKVALNGDFNALVNKPVIDDTLNLLSTNTLQNKVITKALCDISADSTTSSISITEIERLFNE